MPFLPRALLASTLLLSGCQNSQSVQERAPDESHASIEIKVREAEHEEATLSSFADPPIFEWTPPTASWVEVRHEATSRVVWRIEKRSSPRGPSYLQSPLVYGSSGRGPGWSPPPDAAEPVATPAEALTPGERYTVTVHLTALEGPIAQLTDVRKYETTVAFTY